MTKKTLTDLKIQRLKETGIYCDRDGLRLQVTKNKNTGVLRKSWIVRFTVRGGSVREMGLGTYDELPLGEAREKALAARNLARSGVDPLSQRANPQAGLPAKPKPTFRECAEEFIALNKPGWRNKKHADQWTNTLTTYAFPFFGDLPVDQVNIDLVLAALKPIWTAKTETASRVRQRIERVLAFAAVQGHRPRENPAQWRHNLEHILPKPTKVAKVVHHPALPMDEMAEFINVLGGEIQNLSDLRASGAKLDPDAPNCAPFFYARGNEKAVCLTNARFRQLTGVHSLAHLRVLKLSSLLMLNGNGDGYKLTVNIGPSKETGSFIAVRL